MEPLEEKIEVESMGKACDCQPFQHMYDTREWIAYVPSVGVIDSHDDDVA